MRLRQALIAQHSLVTTVMRGVVRAGAEMRLNGKAKPVSPSRVVLACNRNTRFKSGHASNECEDKWFPVDRVQTVRGLVTQRMGSALPKKVSGL